MRTRAERGLLGGMTEVPGTEWNAAFREAGAAKLAPVAQLKWRKLAGIVRHVFTHFPLELTIYSAHAPKQLRAPDGMRFVPLDQLDDEALPRVMRKVIAHATELTPERKTKGRK